MSVIRRLTNLAKGYIKTLEPDAGSSASPPARVDPPEPREPREPPEEREPDSLRARLDRALAEGVLTPEEHAIKVAELQDPPKGPRKRTL